MVPCGAQSCERGIWHGTLDRADLPDAKGLPRGTHMFLIQTMTIALRTAGVSALALLAACRSLPSHPAPDAVQAQLVLPALAARHEIKQGERFLMAAELDAPLPAYPVGAAPDDRVASVCVALVVDEQGRVSGVRALIEEARCAQGDTARFLAATLETVRQWTYFAAAICRPPVGTDDCGHPDAVVEPVASRMAYQFDFIGGRSRVTRTSD